MISDHQQIIHQVERTIAEYRVREVLFTERKVAAREVGELGCQPWPRFTLMLDGITVFRICRGGHVVAEQLSPERAIFITPFSPEKVTVWGEESLAVVLRPNYLRLVYGRFADGVVMREHYWYHLEDTLGKATVHAIMALNEMADQPEAAAELIGTIMKMIYHDLRLSSGDDGGRAASRWRQLADFAEDHCLNRISRTDAAQHFGVTPEYVSRLFRQCGNEGFNEFVNRKRLALAEQMLLTDQSATIDEIAWHCGFSHTSYFIKAFRSRYGMSPGGYRREQPRSAPAILDKVENLK